MSRFKAEDRVVSNTREGGPVGTVMKVYEFGLGGAPDAAEVVWDGDGAWCYVEQRHLERAPEVLSRAVETGEVRVTDPATGGQKGSKPQQPAQIPPAFLLALGEHYAKGNAKYPDVEPGRPNWSRGYAWSLSVNSLFRHLLAWMAGEEFDEDGNHNLIAAAWHAATLYTFQTKGLGTDDRPVY